VQSLLDRVLGPGNSAVQIRADLSFDKAVTETTRYFGNADTALSETETNEILEGGDPDAGVGGLVGPDGQMDDGTGAGTGQNYEKSSRTSDNAINKEVSTVEAAPGAVDGIHVGIVVDPRSPSADAGEIQNLVTAALGIDAERGDTIEVSQLAFDRTAEEAAAAELEASEKAEKSAATWTLIRNGGLAGLLVLIALLAWFQSRRRAKARAQATEYVVEQLRQEQLDRQQRVALEAPAMLALETAEATEEDQVREEITSLVERQPEDVAALLRGWLVESR
jgi:flagellar M-ring protein FliF